MKNRKIKHIRKILCGFLCTVIADSPTVSVSAAEYDEYGAPIVTATPTPVPHTEYYEQAPDTDSIEDWPQGPKIEGETPILEDIVPGAVHYSKNA